MVAGGNLKNIYLPCKKILTVDLTIEHSGPKTRNKKISTSSYPFKIKIALDFLKKML